MSDGATVEIQAGGAVTQDQLEAHEPLLRRAVEAALAEEAARGASISLTLLDDAMMRALNLQYLKRDHATDVIAFPLYQNGQPVVGDVYLGFEQARLQAQELGVAIETELARLAIHGTLHVLGYDHPEEGDREASEMWVLQEQILRKVLE